MNAIRRAERLSAEAHELQRIAHDKLAEAERIVEEERIAAFLEAWSTYDGPTTPRSIALAKDYKSYLGRVWIREQDLDQLPEAASPRRCALHRLAHSRGGDSICAKTFFSLAKRCNL